MDKGLAKSFGPLLEKLEKLNKVQRILISTAIFGLLIGGFIYLSYWPKYENINRLSSELEKLEEKLQVAMKNASDLDKFKAKMAEAESQFQMAMKKLPEKEEIPSLLASISNSGQEVGLEFQLFEPKAEKKKEFYAEIPVVINVKGDYHNTALFFDQVARLPRIVTIENIQMTPVKGNSSRELSTKCMAVTYKFLEQSEQTKNSAKNNKKKKPRRRKK